MRFHDLPQAIQDVMQEQYQKERRDDFAMILDEVLDRFLHEDDIAPRWRDYREDWFHHELHTPDGENHWCEWLRDKGVEP